MAPGYIYSFLDLIVAFIIIIILPEMNVIIPTFRWLGDKTVATMSEKRNWNLNPDRFGFINSLGTRSYFKDPSFSPIFYTMGITTHPLVGVMSVKYFKQQLVYSRCINDAYPLP